MEPPGSPRAWPVAAFSGVGGGRYQDLSDEAVASVATALSYNPPKFFFCVFREGHCPYGLTAAVERRCAPLSWRRGGLSRSVAAASVASSVSE